MRKVVLALAVLSLLAAVGPAQAILYIDDHFETGTPEGWTLYGGARVASSFLFNDPYQPPSGEHWGVGQDAWGGTVDGGLWKQFQDEFVPGQEKTITALVEAMSLDWNYVPTPGDVNIRIGLDPTGATDPDAPSVVWSEWYWGDWSYVTFRWPCEYALETVFVDWFAPWATGPMVAKVDLVTVEQVIPEPGSFLAFGSGLIALAGLALRRRK
jgi:hypothetical protein